MSMISEILENRLFLKHLVCRELRHRYAGSWLGPLWAFVHPLFLMGVYLVVFSWFLGPRINAGHASVPFGVFLVAGFIPWLSVQDTVINSSAIMTENAPLIRQNAFPMILLPLQVVIAALINQLLLASFFAVICIGAGTTSPFDIIWFLPALLVQAILLSGFAMVVSVVSPVFRDIGQMVHLLLTAAFFATPIVYPLSAVPARAASVLRLNPLYWIASLYRRAFASGSEISWPAFLYTLGAAGLVLAGGCFIFKKLRATVCDLV